MIACFDTETTGVDLTIDELLQITIVDENCNILLESYIRPVNRTSWLNAEKVNRISPDMVKDAPTAKELAPKIKEIFDAADKIVGYNVGFDVGFVKKDCKIDIDDNKVEDCLKIFRAECKKKKVTLPHHKLGDAVDFYCPEAKAAYLSNAHDASCDAIATMKVFNAQLDDTKQRYYEKTTELSSNGALKFLNALKNAKEKESNEEEIEI